MPDESQARRRLLAVWSAISTPLILGVIALLFRPGASTPVLATIMAWLFILLAVEALARRNLFRFLTTLVVVGLLVVVVTAVVGLVFFHGWQTTVAICLGVLAVVLLIANLQELARD